MSLRSLSGLCVCSLVVSGVVFSACGSSDDKKRTPMYAGGGEGGDAGQSNTSGSGGKTGPGGDGGNNTSGDGGGVVPSGGGEGGAGGVPAVIPEGGTGEGGAAGAPPTVFHGLYIGENGLDTNGGSEVEPFLTLAHAASLAVAGDTLVFLDGSFEIATQVVIPAGVNVMAKNAGGATLKPPTNGGPAFVFTIQGDTRIEGLKFTNDQAVASFAGVGPNPGTLTIVDSVFVACKSPCLVLSGGAVANVSAAKDAVIGEGGYGFATLTTGATLNVTDGVFQNHAQTDVFYATDSNITLTDTQVLNGSGRVLYLRGQGSTLLDGVKFATLGAGQTLIDIADKGTLTIKHSDLSINPNVGGIVCIYMEMNGVGTLDIQDSKLHDCGTALKGAVAGQMTIAHSEFSQLSFGGMDIGDGNVGGVVRIDDLSIHDVGYTSMRLGGGNHLMDLKIRNSSFVITAASQWDNVILNGSNSSSIDLGKVGDPGGNTFLGLSNLKTGVRLGYQAVPTVYAVGNTWAVNAQGADAQGHYAAAAGAGNKLEITGTVADGQNYAKPYPGTTLRLAENP